MLSDRQRGRKPPQKTESYWTTEYQERFVAPYRNKVTRAKAATPSQTSGGKAPPGQVPIGKASVGKTFGPSFSNKIPPVQTYGGKTSRGQTSSGKTSRGQPSGAKTTVQPSVVQPSDSLPAKTMAQQDDGETTVRTFCVSHKWTEAPVLPAPLVETTQQSLRYKKPPHMPLPDREKTDYTTLYMDDFRSWNVKRQKPIIQKHNLNVREGLGFKNTELTYMPEPVIRDEEPGPMESITSYREDYINHPIQRIPRMLKGSGNKGGQRITSASVPTTGMSASTMYPNQDPGLAHEFKIWSVETNYNPKLKGAAGPAGGRFQANVPVDFDTLLHPLPNCKEINDVLQKAASMTRDCQLWDAVQCCNANDRKTQRTCGALRPKGNTVVMGDPLGNTGEGYSTFQTTTDNGETRKICWSTNVGREGLQG